MDEKRLLERLKLIEGLFAGAGTAGERDAAEAARERILKRLKSYEKVAPPIEYKFTFTDQWSRQIFVALARRYGLRPFRYKRQRYTTVMLNVPERFVDETLWPEFSAFDDTLKEWLSEVTQRVVSQVTGQDAEEAEVREAPKRLK